MTVPEGDTGPRPGGATLEHAASEPRTRGVPSAIANWLLSLPLIVKLVVANAIIVGLAAAGVLIAQRLPRASADESILVMALAVAGAMLLSLLVNALVVRSALSPLRELERVASAVDRGDRAARAELRLVRDPQTALIATLTNRILDAHEAALREIERTAAELARLSDREFHAREEERRAVADELRGQIGQTYTAITVGLRSVARGIDSDSIEPASLAARIQELIEIARSSYDLVQSRAQDLRPSTLDDLGLLPALRSAATRWTELYGLPVTFTASGPPPRLASAEGIALFRVVEAAVDNAVQHARAKRIDIGLEVASGAVTVTVRDDGQGFDVDAVRDRWSLGLVGMRERVGLLGGTLRIESSAGAGTIVRATIPAGGVGSEAPHLRPDAATGPATVQRAYQ